MSTLTDPVGYTFRAATYCPLHIGDAVAATDEYDGWALAVPMSAEENLDEIAASFGIDRDDETTFDSDQFPKVILATHGDRDLTCDECGEAV